MASQTCLRFWISQINEYLRTTGYQIDPLPEVVLDDSESDPSDLLIGTGHYDCKSFQIVLRISQRHLKDILRSIVAMNEDPELEKPVKMILSVLDDKEDILRTFAQLEYKVG